MPHEWICEKGFRFHDVENGLWV